MTIRANRTLTKLVLIASALLLPQGGSGRNLTDANRGKLPGGLNLVDWTAIRQEYERHRHAVLPVAGGYQARNYEQQLVARFDGRGFTVEPDSERWQWGLQLVGYGFAGRIRALHDEPLVEADRDRISYRWNQHLEEWFVNRVRGVEHGFTLRERPAGGGDTLQLHLEIRGGLQPQLLAGGGGAGFTNADGRTVLLYTGLKVWDADRKVLGARMEVSHDRLVLAVDERNARYPLTIDPVVQQAYLKGRNTVGGNLFGFSVAISGETVVVGTPNDANSSTGVNNVSSANNAPRSGAVYVFVRNNGAWSQQAYIKASNTGALDQFGYSVAISGDTLVVGAIGESSNTTGIDGDQNDNSSSNSGAAYIFVRSGGVWGQQAYVKASNTDQGNAFGVSVSISGDSVVVGAYGESSGATGVNGNQALRATSQAGAAYVFVRNAGVWSQQAYLKASNTEAFDQFGGSVAISGDIIVVGAPDEASNATGVNGNQGDNSAFGAGAAFVYVRNAGVWSQQAYLKASNSDARDFFGFSVAVSGNTVVVGAYNESSNATGINGNQADNSGGLSGAAYIFVRNGTAWSQQAYLKASNTGASDGFGYNLSVSGDTVVVGALGEDSSATGVNGDQSDNSAFNAGAAYLFVRSAGAWSQLAYLKASNAGITDQFGGAVAVSGDTVVVGASREASSSATVNGDQNDNNAPLAGAAYTFIIPAQTGLRFVPLTPCRLVDTRAAYAGPRTGAFGAPLLAAQSTRTIPIPSSATCTVPSTAKAYVLNVTLDTVENQTGPVDFVTIWPSGETRPDFYTARTSTGGYIANAAIVKAGTGGAVNVHTSNNVNLILDISGYFTDDAGTAGLVYYPVSPCRAVDTRGPVYSSLPAPYGNQKMQSRENRTFRLPGSPACQIPVAAAYSMQLTLAPGDLTNGNPVAFITAYPTGVSQPNISNMNAVFGYAVANSAIVPASANGSIDVFAYDATNLIIDVNGYFAPDDGSGRGLFYQPVTQCRVMNTQDSTFTGAFGSPMLSPGTDRTVPVPAGRCAGLPDTARAWAINASVAPNGVAMPFLSLWPSGTPWPNISQLNAFQGQTVANSGIVPASPTGSIDVRAAGTTHAALEVSGYFSR